MMGLHMFDYNLDFFGPGTVDAPQWKKAAAVRTRRGNLDGSYQLPPIRREG
jgi:hypothetical protein